MLIWLQRLLDKVVCWLDGHLFLPNVSHCVWCGKKKP